jgi:DNA-binding MarR family transcriptional regulator
MPAVAARSERRLVRSAHAGAALRRLVDLVSHRSGLALAVMSEAAVTLPQVLLLSRVERCGTTSPTEIAAAIHGSLPAVSQMVDRLVHQGFLGRTEDPVDRRRKSVATTPEARAFLRKLGAARSAEYEHGLASVDPELLVELAALVERVIAQLKAGHPGVGRTSRSPARRAR